MTLSARAVGTLLAMLVCIPPVSAHHSFSPVYDDKRTISIEGVVIEFKLVNPHALMSMDVTDDSGKTTRWVVEFAGRLSLTEGGWTPEIIEAGERVRVTGNPTHTGSQRLFFRRLVRADGTELLPPGAEQLSAVEAERRERARHRATPQK